MYVKHGADTTDAWLRQPIRLIRQYLGDVSFFKWQPLGRVLPKLSQRSPSARAKRGMWGTVRMSWVPYFFKIRTNLFNIPEGLDTELFDWILVETACLHFNKQGYTATPI